jgi:hypothetical protein
MTFKLYIAGVYTANFRIGGSLYNRLTENEKWQRCSVANHLESYHYIHRQSFVDSIRADGKKVFLDSGAFSAFTQGVEIDLPGYCDYIKRNTDIIEQVDGVLMASVLDGIGDPKRTLENQQAMEKRGVRPLPCFHYGEPEEYLEHYIANYEYITLGGMVAQSDVQLYHWLDRIWDKHLTDGSGRPRIRVHGFGVTTLGLMKRYPWYSTDSSSWVQIARTGGMVLLPEARVVNVSDQSPNRRVEGQHIDTLPPMQRAALETRFREHGVDTARMRETYLSRWCYDMYAFDQLGKMVDAEKRDPVFTLEQPGIFD